MEEVFGRIVDQIFNNWTGLKLAVEHSMGGPNSLKKAADLRDYMINFCLYENNVETEDIQDALDDLMDEEFQTIFEDNSTKEISIILYNFLKLIKENQLEQCEIEFNNLPKSTTNWLSLSQSEVRNESIESSSDSESNDEAGNAETPMEEDSEWTVVKTRKKR